MPSPPSIADRLESTSSNAPPSPYTPTTPPLPPSRPKPRPTTDSAPMSNSSLAADRSTTTHQLQQRVPASAISEANLSYRTAADLRPAGGASNGASDDETGSTRHNAIPISPDLPSAARSPGASSHREPGLSSDILRMLEQAMGALSERGAGDSQNDARARQNSNDPDLPSSLEIIAAHNAWEGNAASSHPQRSSDTPITSQQTTTGRPAVSQQQLRRSASAASSHPGSSMPTPYQRSDSRPPLASQQARSSAFNTWGRGRHTSSRPTASQQDSFRASTSRQQQHHQPSGSGFGADSQRPSLPYGRRRSNYRVISQWPDATDGRHAPRSSFAVTPQEQGATYGRQAPRLSTTSQRPGPNYGRQEPGYGAGSQQYRPAYGWQQSRSGFATGLQQPGPIHGWQEPRVGAPLEQRGPAYGRQEPRFGTAYQQHGSAYGRQELRSRYANDLPQHGARTPAASQDQRRPSVFAASPQPRFGHHTVSPQQWSRSSMSVTSQQQGSSRSATAQRDSRPRSDGSVGRTRSSRTSGANPSVAGATAAPVRAQGQQAATLSGEGDHEGQTTSFETQEPTSSVTWSAAGALPQQRQQGQASRGDSALSASSSQPEGTGPAESVSLTAATTSPQRSQQARVPSSSVSASTHAPCPQAPDPVPVAGQTATATPQSQQRQDLRSDSGSDRPLALSQTPDRAPDGGPTDAPSPPRPPHQARTSPGSFDSEVSASFDSLFDTIEETRATEDITMNETPPSPFLAPGARQPAQKTSAATQPAAETWVNTNRGSAVPPLAPAVSTPPASPRSALYSSRPDGTSNGSLSRTLSSGTHIETDTARLTSGQPTATPSTVAGLSGTGAGLSLSSVAAPSGRSSRWAPAEDDMLIAAIAEHGVRWDKVLTFVRSRAMSRTKHALQSRWSTLGQLATRTPQLEAARQAAAATPSQRKWPLWTVEEDTLLRQGLSEHTSWDLIIGAFETEFAPTQRSRRALDARLWHLRSAMYKEQRAEARAEVRAAVQAEGQEDDAGEDMGSGGSREGQGDVEDVDMVPSAASRAAHGSAIVREAGDQASGDSQQSDGQASTNTSASGAPVSRVAAAGTSSMQTRTPSQARRGARAGNNLLSWSQADDARLLALAASNRTSLNRVDWRAIVPLFNQAADKRRGQPALGTRYHLLIKSPSGRQHAAASSASTSTAPLTSLRKRKREGQQQHGSSWTAREDRVLRACMFRGPGGWASFEDLRKGYKEAFPLSTRTDNALKVRRSILYLARDARHVNGEDADDDDDDGSEEEDDSDDNEEASHEEEEEEAEEESEGEADEGRDDAIMADSPAMAGRTLQGRSDRQLLALDTVPHGDERTSEANERSAQPDRSVGASMDQQLAHRATAARLGPEADVQLQSCAASASAPAAAPVVAPRHSICPSFTASTSASASHVREASASSSSTAPSTSAPASNPPDAASSQHADRYQGVAPSPVAVPAEATAPIQPTIRPSYMAGPPAAALAPSAPSQTATSAAPVAQPPSAMSASSHQPLPVLTIPEPNGLRFERCVAGIEIEVSARNRATISWSDPSMPITPSYPPSSSFERLPAFHLKVLDDGKVLPVRLPPMTMKRVLADARGMEMAVVGVATEMGAQVCFTGPDGYSVTLAS